MRLSTSTCLYTNNRFSEWDISTEEIMRRCYNAGFRVLDMNLCTITRGKTECARDDWREQMHRIRNLADKMGIEFSQSHPPFYPIYPAAELPDKPGYFAHFKEMMYRSLEASAILGVKWAVMHPFTDNINAEFDNDISLKMNLEFYAPYVEFAKKLGVGLAFENMAEYRPEHKRKYCATAKEMCELTDAFKDDEAVGICWDFGHANNMYSEQVSPLKMVGKRLRATHVDDNKKDYDAHTVPLIEGNVDWPAVMRTLREIDYKGDFTYEIHGMTNLAPDALKDSIARFCYNVGMYCLSLADKEDGAR